MKRSILFILSLVPGVVFAQGTLKMQRIRVTSGNSDDVLKSLTAIQAASLAVGESKIKIIIDNIDNSVEISVAHPRTTADMVDRLKRELGDSVVVEQVDHDSISHATQDGIMVP